MRVVWERGAAATYDLLQNLGVCVRACVRVCARACVFHGPTKNWNAGLFMSEIRINVNTSGTCIQTCPLCSPVSLSPCVFISLAHTHTHTHALTDLTKHGNASRFVSKGSLPITALLRQARAGRYISVVRAYLHTYSDLFFVSSRESS